MTQSTHLGPQESDEVLAEFTQAARAVGRNLERIGYRVGMIPRGSRGLIGRKGRRAVVAGRRGRDDRSARLAPQQRRAMEEQYPMAKLAGRWAVAHEIARAAEQQRSEALASADNDQGEAERWRREAELARQHADAWDNRVREHGLDPEELRHKIGLTAAHDDEVGLDAEAIRVAGTLARDYLAEHIEIGDAQSVADLEATALGGQELIDVGSPNGVDLPPTTGSDQHVAAESAWPAPELGAVADLDSQTSWITPAAGEWPADGVDAGTNHGVDR